jgi:hypothetical protein
MMSPKILFIIGSLLFIGAGWLPAQELVVNGSFENSSNTFVADGNESMSLPAGSVVIPGWTTTNAELLWISNSNPFGPTTPYGEFFLDFTGYHDSYPYGGVTQTLSTTPGQTYAVSFSLGQYQEKSIYSGPLSATAYAGVGVTSNITFTPNTGGANQWSNFQMNFTAQSDTTTISLIGLTAAGGQYLGLDNVSLTAQGGGPELLVNGSFEDTNGAFVIQSEGAMSLPRHSTTISGWTTTTAEIAWITNSTPLGLMTPYGSMFLDLTGYHDSVPYGGVAQTVTTTAGQSYTLSFSLGVDEANSAYSGPVSVQASVQSGAEFFTTADGGSWQSFSFTFVANSNSTPVVFTGASTTGGQLIGFDNASVTPATPQFIITSVEAFSISNLVIYFNSQLGQNYAVQSSTSLNSALWTFLNGTTNAGTGGNMSVTLTNAISGDRQFYRIAQLQ